MAERDATHDEPAFPSDADRIHMRHGPSMRDWLAGQALAGMLAAGLSEDTFEDYADGAYLQADAMLERRKR